MGGFRCDDCYDGLLVPKGECPTCGPSAVPRSHEEIAKFRHRLASPKWHELLADAYLHLGLKPLDRQGNLGLSVVLVDRLNKMLWQHPVRSDKAMTILENPLEPLMVWWWIELQRVTATLASYLGTSSTDPILRLLMEGTPVDPKLLVPASPGKALEKFDDSLLRLLGFSLSAPFSDRLRGTRRREACLIIHVNVVLGKFGRTWDHTRITWNKAYPAWAYPPGDGLRKAFRLAVKHRPPSDTD